MFNCFDSAYRNIFISHISRYFMSSIQTFRDTFCRRKHQYVVQALKKNQRVKSSLSRSSNSIINNTISWKRMSWKKSLIRNSQYKKNEMIMISQIMYRYRKRCYESLYDEQLEFFASNRIRELSSFFLFESEAWNEITNMLVDVFVSQVRFRIELLEFSLCYSCARFSLWSIHFIDIKEIETTHLSISCTTFFKYLLHSLCYTSYQISSFIRTMTVSWNSQRQIVDRLFYFARDLTLIISNTQEMTSEQKYLKQREWVDFCVRRQNLLQETMKRVWTWIKNDRSWQKFHKSFAEFEENYFDLIFIIRQTRDMKRMTKKIMSHIAVIWESNFRVFKTLDLHTLRSMKKCARIDYTMMKTLQSLKKTVIYQLHHSRRKIFKEILLTTTNWSRVIDDFRMQESISEDALKVFNLKDERSFLSREREQSTFAHINLENSSKIIQDLTKSLMNETQQLLFTFKSTSTKLVRDLRRDENQTDLNDQTQFDLNNQTQFDLNDQTQFDLNDQTQLDLNDQTQSDLNDQIQSDLDRQRQTRNKRRRQDSDERNDCDCRESNDIWKRDLEEHDDNTHDERKALLLLFSIFYARWSLCVVHQSILRRVFKLIEHDSRRVFATRLNCVWNARWDIAELKSRNRQWFQQDWDEEINYQLSEFLCFLKLVVRLMIE